MSVRTSRKDRNFFSVSNNTYEYYSGTDNPVSVPLLPKAPFFEPDQPETWDSCFKYTNGSHGHTFSGMRVSQGRENWGDFNDRAHDARFYGEFGLMGAEKGDQGLTVKGGCYGLRFGGTIYSNGRNADVVVGAWSDQCFDQSHDLDFSGLVRADGKPVTFILARCKRVKLPPGAKILRFKSLGYSIYWWAKLAAVKLGLFG